MRRHAAAYAVYRVPVQHRTLASLIDAGAPGRSVMDPVDNVILVCHRSRHWCSCIREVARIHGQDAAQVTARMDSQAPAEPFVVPVERFILAPLRAPYVARRVEPLRIRIDEHGSLVDATDPTPPLSRREKHDRVRFMLTTGVGFASPDELDTLIAQLRRAQPVA